MSFTYEWYRDFIRLIKSNYVVKDWDDTFDGVILRHDIDYDLKKAYEFALLEQSLDIKSTYFLLLSGEFYNLFTEGAYKYIHGILEAGHKIGLHFDEAKYANDSTKAYFQEKIEWESRVLSEIIGVDVKVVSMHRPSERMLNWNIEIPNVLNTYSKKFFNDYKYISDSRRRWREPVTDILRENTYKNVQILIHPFWYLDEECDIHKTISDFVNRANQERYDHLNENITDLSGIMKRSEVV